MNFSPIIICFIFLNRERNNARGNIGLFNGKSQHISLSRLFICYVLFSIVNGMFSIKRINSLNRNIAVRLISVVIVSVVS